MPSPDDEFENGERPGRRRAPLLSIGVPVRNGARWLGAALESITNQDFEDIEVLVCDNASDDETVSIARSVAQRDPRVQVFENDTNIGGAGNYNRVFELARGKYFKWAAHDDLCAQGFFSRCVEVLEQNEDCVIAFPKTRYVDEDGGRIRDSDGDLDLVDADAADRAVRLLDLADRSDDVWMSIFGVYRSQVLARTPRIASHVASDQTLLFELVFHGTFREVDAPLFVRRMHEKTSMVKDTSPRAQATWFDPAHGRRFVLPMWQLWKEHRAVLARRDLTAAARRRVRRRLARRFLRKTPALAGELKKVAVQYLLRR